MSNEASVVSSVVSTDIPTKVPTTPRKKPTGRPVKTKVQHVREEVEKLVSFVSEQLGDITNKILDVKGLYDDLGEERSVENRINNALDQRDQLHCETLTTIENSHEAEMDALKKEHDHKIKIYELERTKLVESHESDLEHWEAHNTILFRENKELKEQLSKLLAFQQKLLGGLIEKGFTVLQSVDNVSDHPEDSF